MAGIAWTSEAQRWLEEIHTYIAEDDPAAADRVVQGIFEQAQLLSDFPLIGHRY